MSTTVLGNYDYNGNQVLNMVLQNLTTDPSSPTPKEGQLYHNTTSHLPMYHNGTSFVSFVAALSNVTNDTQTKASVVPNTLPSAGQILVGNAGGTAYGPQTISGDATLVSTGAITVTKSTNLKGGNSTTLLGSIPYQSDVSVTTLLSPNTTSVKNFLSQTGDGTNGAVPIWSAVSKSDVGLSSVENTALSTWIGTSNITTLGTITTGTWHGTAIGNSYLANSAITIGTTSVSLGASSTSIAGLTSIDSTAGATSFFATTTNPTLFASGTAVNIGANTGITTVNNNLLVNGNLTVEGTVILNNEVTIQTADKILLLGIGITGSYGNGTVSGISGSGPWTATLTVASTAGLVPGMTLTATAGTGTLYGGSPSSVVLTSITNSTQFVYTVTGGTTPTVGTVTSTTLSGQANDTYSNGGGIQLGGTTNKTFTWSNSLTAWSSSENMNLVSGKIYEINGTSVLSATALGTGIVSSSLTSVGTIATGVWNGTALTVTYGGTGYTSLGTNGTIARKWYDNTTVGSYAGGVSTFTIAHGFGLNVCTYAIDASGYKVEIPCQNTTANSGTTIFSINSASLVAAGTYTFIIIG